MISQGNLPQNKVSIGLNKRVVCPVCGKEGSLTARQRGKRWYLYVRHLVKEGGKWKIIEHYIGPARLYYISERLAMKPLVKVHAYAGHDRASVSYTLAGAKNISKPEVLRQSMMDYCALLTWLKDMIEKEIEKTKRNYGITDGEITERLKEIKKHFATLIFYKKT